MINSLLIGVLIFSFFDLCTPDYNNILVTDFSFGNFNSAETCDELINHSPELAQGYTPPLQLTQYECGKSLHAYTIHTINKNAHYPEKNWLQRDLSELKGFN